MACDTAFRIIARRYLDAIIARHAATCAGEPDALHETRLALTHLRTAIRFFRPMLDDADRKTLVAGLKWLNGELGRVRDIDVAIDQIVAASGEELSAIAGLDAWTSKRDDSLTRLVRALHSARYQRLMLQASDWITRGPWSTCRSKHAVRLRAMALAHHAGRRLARWERQLLRRSRHLDALDVGERHKLRLLTKRVTCSAEFLRDLFGDRAPEWHDAALKQLRRAQRSLGRLNDDARARALARSHKGGRRPRMQTTDHRQSDRLLRSASEAYAKLRKSKPFQGADWTDAGDGEK